jgi:hypothetical protein
VADWRARIDPGRQYAPIWLSSAWLRNLAPLSRKTGNTSRLFRRSIQVLSHPQLIWLAITFGLLYVLLKRFFLPHIEAIQNERSDRIKGDFALTEKLKKDTEAAISMATWPVCP